MNKVLAEELVMDRTDQFTDRPITFGEDGIDARVAATGCLRGVGSADVVGVG